MPAGSVVVREPPAAAAEGLGAGVERGRLRGALRNSFCDGLFSSATVGLVERFAMPAIILLGAEELGVGAFGGIALLVAALAHLASPRLAALAPSRRSVVVVFARVQALACAALGAAGFLPAGAALAAAIAAYAAYCMAGSLTYGPWSSWMSALVPRAARGRYFSWRNSWGALIAGLLPVAAGCIMRRQWGPEPAATPWAALAAVFAVAAAARLGASLFLGRQYEPPLRQKLPLEDFSYWQFLARTGRSNFANFTVVLALLFGAANFSGPLFQLYLLRDLRLDYATIMLLPATSLAATVVFVRFWGRVADRWGNMLVIRICATTLVAVPLLYLGPPRLGLIFLAWAVGGASWAGLGLASFNYVMEAATPLRRVRCFAYMQATVGTLCALFIFAGGLLSPHLPLIFPYRLQSAFLLSALMRAGPALAMWTLVRELSDKPRASALDLFNELPAMRPTVDFFRSMARPFMRS